MIRVDTQIRKDGHMEENAQKFLEKMNELVALGKKKKSILDVQEINDFFTDMDLSAEQMEKVFEYLEGNMSLEETIDTIKKDTRHFAKRQITWFKRERDVIWIDKKEHNYDEKIILDTMLTQLKGIR